MESLPEKWDSTGSRRPDWPGVVRRVQQRDGDTRETLKAAEWHTPTDRRATSRIQGITIRVCYILPPLRQGGVRMRKRPSATKRAVALVGLVVMLLVFWGFLGVVRFLQEREAATLPQRQREEIVRLKAIDDRLAQFTEEVESESTERFFTSADAIQPGTPSHPYRLRRPYPTEADLSLVLGAPLTASPSSTVWTDQTTVPGVTHNRRIEGFWGPDGTLQQLVIVNVGISVREQFGRETSDWQFSRSTSRLYDAF